MPVVTPLAANVPAGVEPPPADRDDDAPRALPSVESLPPGTRPTEPGWYVALDQDHYTLIVQVADQNYDGESGLVVYYAGSDCTWPLDGEIEDGSLTFLARIYPDRIGQE